MKRVPGAVRFGLAQQPKKRGERYTVPPNYIAVHTQYPGLHSSWEDGHFEEIIYPPPDPLPDVVALTQDRDPVHPTLPGARLGNRVLSKEGVQRQQTCQDKEQGTQQQQQQQQRPFLSYEERRQPADFSERAHQHQTRETWRTPDPLPVNQASRTPLPEGERQATIQSPRITSTVSPAQHETGREESSTDRRINRGTSPRHVPDKGPNLKKPPAQPNASIAVVQDGIVFSWNMKVDQLHADIDSYELFACQNVSESTIPPILWKKIGIVKALPLPMACTLTQFSVENKYHFAVRAVDVHERAGPFSDACTICLTGKGGKAEESPPVTGEHFRGICTISNERSR